MQPINMLLLFVTFLWILLPLLASGDVLFIRVEKPCAAVKAEACIQENFNGTGECLEKVGGLTIQVRALVMKNVSASSHNETSSSILNDLTVRHIAGVVEVEVRARCRLTLCDERNLMGLNCHQFGFNQNSYKFTPNNLNPFQDMYRLKVKSYLCVCEQLRISEDGSEIIENWESQERWTRIKPAEQFDRNFMGVMFCPSHNHVLINQSSQNATEVSNVNELYTKDEVHSSLTTVATRFTQIGIYTMGLTKEPIDRILHAVADLNTQYEFLITRVALEVTEDQLNNVLYAIKIVNKRFPGTVWGILISHGPHNENLVENIRKLKEAIRRENLTQLMVGFRIGIKPAPTVGRPTRSTLKIKEVVKVADFMINTYIPTEEELLIGTLQQMEKTLLERRKRYYEINPKMKYFAGTGIPSKGLWGNFKHSCKNLQNYWRRIGNLSRNHRLPFFMQEATDQPWKYEFNDKLGNGDSFGWWEKNATRLVEKQCSDEDKVGESEKPASAQSQQWIILFGAVGACTVILVVSIAVYWTRIRIRRNRPDLHGLSKSFMSGGVLTTSEEEKQYIVAIKQPYDRKNELFSNEIEILEKEKVISSRDGVTVVHATIHGKFNCRAILKRTSAQSSVTSIKHLLTEIKIYSYIGPHEHVVWFLGAVTTKIDHGIVQMALECCPMGNLETFLRKVDSSLLDERIPLELTEGDLANSLFPVRYVTVADTTSLSSGSRSGVSDSNGYRTTYSDLTEFARKDSEFSMEEVKVAIDLPHIISWCHQIASVMEFLSSKLIVHADLATRNILLASLNHIKLSDFGLSKKQYVELGQVTHDRDTPLPWRWMAPESLRNIVFSTQTDVWSCGVTIWEIFSLGQVPFHVLQDYTAEFVDYLENNHLRLSRPRYASQSVYDLLLDCWNTSSDARPSFAQIERFFRELLNETGFCNDPEGESAEETQSISTSREAHVYDNEMEETQL